MAKLTLTASEALDRAFSAYNAGKLAEAERLCQKLIDVKPDLFDALHLLAVVQSSLNRKDTALESFDQALTVRPDSAEALSNRGRTLHELKRFKEALVSYDRALTVRPDYAEALFNRGLTLHELKRSEEALASYDNALTVRPAFARALFNRGLILDELKRFADALGSYDRALTVRPDYAEALFKRGNALNELRRFEEALASYDRALTVRPDYAEALSNRGLILHELGRFEEALVSYDRALTVRPDSAEVLSNRGNSLHELKRFEEALASYDRALTVRLNFAEALSNRGLALHELERFEEALANYNKAIAIKPDYAVALSNRALTLCELKRFKEALESVNCALGVRPDFAKAHLNRGLTLRELKRFEEALESYDKAIALKPDFASAYNNKGTLLKELGQLQKAQDAYLDAIRLDPRIAAAYANLADSKSFVPDDPHLAAIEALAAKTEGLSKTDRMQLDFTLGKAYADLKDYRRSFQHLLKGNAGKRAMISYDEKSALALFDRIETVFTPELIKAKSGSGEPSPMPIFVIGMPRSGTTLVEQIIASHPMVHGAGELQTLNDVVLTVRGPGGNTISFPEFVPALDASALKQIGARYVASVRKLAPMGARVTDKMPSNYYFAGLIHLTLPNAKIIHTVRDPIDTCISCFSRLFMMGQEHTYNLGELGRYYKRYEELMAHWRRILPRDRIFDVRYEDVIADLDGQARRIISHLGLPWDKSCLSFHETIRPIKTSSATQVRRPIYTSAIGRWRVYEEHLGPLLSALGIVTSVET